MRWENAKTQSCLNLPIITITDFKDLTVPLLSRFCVMITARINPGEPNSNWAMEVN